MLEKDFTTKFNKWLHYHWHEQGKFEIKIAKGTSLPYSAVMEHQLDALLARKVIHKIVDVAEGGRKPFDVFVATGVGYVVVYFYYKRGIKKFYIIDAYAFAVMKATSQRKSLTLEEAEVVACVIGEVV